MQAKTYLTVTLNQEDRELQAFQLMRQQLEVREAIGLGLSVVQTDNPDADGLEVPDDPDAFKVYCVSGPHEIMVDWWSRLCHLGVNSTWYEVEVPPEAVAEEPTGELWADFTEDRVDEPGIHFTGKVCRDAQEWGHGLRVAVAS